MYVTELSYEGITHASSSILTLNLNASYLLLLVHTVEAGLRRPTSNQRVCTHTDDQLSHGFMESINTHTHVNRVLRIFTLLGVFFLSLFMYF